MIREGAARAAALHLALSAVVVGAFLALVISVWYPPPLLQGAGGMRLVLIVAAVDLVAGPLITLLIYKRGKPGLAFDLTVIALLQASALAYGLHTTWVSRPAYLVLSPYRATLVAANELYPADESAKAPFWGAHTVIAIPPDDTKGKQALLEEIMDGKPDVDYRPEFYEPLSPAGLAQLKPTADSADAAGWTLPLLTRDQELAVRIDESSPNRVSIIER
jgi:hypothetical protein